MLIARRYLIGAVLSSLAIGGALALDYIGPAGNPAPLVVQFTRGTALAQGEAARVSAFVGEHVAEPSLRFHVLGHTGDRGDADANLALSQDRAQAVADLLKEAGLDEAQLLSVQGIGSARPLAAGPEESDGALQRRMARVVVTPVVRK
ncbi:MAG: OmpA family protein [Pseudomonadota bacterium]